MKHGATELEWFNALSVLTFSEDYAKEFYGIVKDTEELVKMIVNNHQLYAENCGLDYLPVSRLNEKQVEPYLIGITLNDNDHKEYEKICQKLIGNMHIPNRELLYEITIKHEKLNELMSKTPVLNLFFE
jgi:hypothetical protein